MLKKLLPITALTTLALTQSFFPFVSTAENIPVKSSRVDSTNSKEYIDSISLSKTFGTPNFMSGNLSESSKGSAEKTVHSFLNESKHTYKLKKNATESFKVIKQEKNMGDQVVRLQQEYNGIKVFGYQQIAHLNEGILESFSGSVAPEAILEEGIKNGKQISKEQAINLAKQDLKIKPIFIQAPTSELNIYMNEDKANLVYLVKLNFMDPEPGNWFYFIDARTGKVIEKFNTIAHEVERDNGTQTTIEGKGVLGDTKSIISNKIEDKYYLQDFTRGSGIHTFDGSTAAGPLPGKIWVDDDGSLNETLDGAAVDAHYYAGIVYDFYKKHFNRNSYDNRGASMYSSVHYGSNYNNAFWNGQQMVYGDGDGETFIPLSGALDVIGHELTHAVTEHTAGLIYFGESGAINESISDIIGTLVEFDNDKDPDWKIGEDVYTPKISGDALRNMSDPTIVGDPDHFSKRYRGKEDNSGVHYNSSIINKAAYLMSEGGTHYGVKVKGFGKEKLGEIFYRTLTNYLTPNSNFMQLRLSAIQATKDLFGNKATEVKTVEDAFTAVGIIQSPKDKEIQTVQLNTPTSIEFKKPGEIKWFKVDPHDAFGPNSHLNFTVKGDSPTYITVYRDKESADAGKSFINYSEGQDQNFFPLSNDTPIYVRVESSGIGLFTFNSQPIYQLPGEPPEFLNCLAEVSAEHDSSVFSLLGSLREIRDNLLQKTEKGRNLSALYYKISKEVVDDAIFNSDFRKSVAKDLKELERVIDELQKISDGENSIYQITKHDIEVMQHLKETVESKASKKSIEDLNEFWDSIHLKEGDILSESINDFGLTNISSNKIIVKVKNGVTLDQLREVVDKTVSKLRLKDTPKINGLANKVVSIENTFTLELNGNSKELVKQLKNQSLFEYVEVSKQVHAFSEDTQYKTQWSLENNAQGTGVNQPIGTTGADINFKGMEKFLKGKKKLRDTVIAVVDTGVAYDLDDFKGIALTKYDYDFHNNDDDAMDDHGHGTHVAGIIAAKGNNRTSMTGINQHAKILPVKVLDAKGSGLWENVALGIHYATNLGAKVINLSLGGDIEANESLLMEDALKYAVSNGVTVVAATGNNGKTELSYPASSKYSISVGSTNNSDALSTYSNTGEGLDLVAPGERIPSLYPVGEVYYLSGTSMAAPHVTAVAGLLYSLNPSISVSDVKRILQESAHDLGDEGYDQKFGSGRLDAAAAVMKVNTKQIKSKPKYEFKNSYKTLR